ncbi:hypothetical protein ACM7T0_28310 [Pseudomonas aeruginosa]
MTKANECTCPSGDGSLRHPCPAHPASVELAGVAANLTFINGRPAMCGCQVEYSSGGGEYSDVIYVTLCAKHSGSAILDLVATNRIALTPEYEGKWHADLYLDREIPLAKAEGATPAEAVLALMSAERIDPEQESVEQAGGDERVIGWRERILAAHPNSDPGFWPDALLVEHMAAEIADLRAALTQPSPASDLDPLNLAPHAKAFNEAPAEALKPEQAEAERPELWAVHAQGPDELYAAFTREDAEKHAAELNALPMPEGIAVGAVVVPSPWPEAEHWKYLAEQERDHKNEIAVRLRQFERICEGLPQDAIDGCWTVQGIRGYAKLLEDQLKSALARVAELERKLRNEENAHTTTIEQRDNAEHWADQLANAIAERFGVDIGEHSNLNCPWNEALVWMQQLPAQAQHSVPELDQLYSMLGAESQVDAAKKIAELIGCRMSRSALTEAQMRRIYENSTEIENERLGFAAFARLMRRAEAVHQIAAAPGKEGV